MVAEMQDESWLQPKWDARFRWLPCADEALNSEDGGSCPRAMWSELGNGCRGTKLCRQGITVVRERGQRSPYGLWRRSAKRGRCGFFRTPSPSDGGFLAGSWPMGGRAGRGSIVATRCQAYTDAYSMGKRLPRGRRKFGRWRGGGGVRVYEYQRAA